MKADSIVLITKPMKSTEQKGAKCCNGASDLLSKD